MKPGEKIFLYTDGVTEAFNSERIAIVWINLKNS